jgi:hypothetical protein
MKILEVDYNIISQLWTIGDSRIFSDDLALNLMFSSNDEISTFNNLRFGFELLDNSNNILQIEAQPQYGIVYNQSKTVPLLTSRLAVENNKEYKIRIWASNNFKFSETSVEIRIENPGPGPIIDNSVKTGSY